MNWYEGLSLQARAAVSEYASPCEAAFERLAQSHPADLLRLCSSGILRPGCLTYAAEHVGTIRDSAAVRSVLVPLLNSSSPMVREGALYGLRQHADAGTRAMIQELAAMDASEDVRVAAAGVLEDIEDGS